MATEDSYHDIAYEGAFKGRVRALWACSALGFACGAALGLVAPVFPALTGVSVTTAMVTKSLAIFSAVGMTAGLGVGAMVGNASGAVAAVAQEQERRQRRQEGQSPAQAHVKENLTPFQRLKDSFEQSKGKYFNPKVAAVFAAIGAVGGLVMAGAFFALGGTGSAEASGWAMHAMKGLLGEAPTKIAITTYFAGIMGSFGALFALTSLNFPLI